MYHVFFYIDIYTVTLKQASYHKLSDSSFFVFMWASHLPLCPLKQVLIHTSALIRNKWCSLHICSALEIKSLGSVNHHGPSWPLKSVRIWTWDIPHPFQGYCTYFFTQDVSYRSGLTWGAKESMKSFTVSAHRCLREAIPQHSQENSEL